MPAPKETDPDHRMGSLPFDPIFSNSKVYREIAEEALKTSDSMLQAHRRPKDDGSPGYVLVDDPARSSFKHSLIAIVFAGMFIEAQLWLHGCRQLGKVEYTRIDRWELEKRLVALGIVDQVLEADLKAYRYARKELVHEKAVPFSLNETPMRLAQKEAAKAVNLMHRIESALSATGA